MWFPETPTYDGPAQPGPCQMQRDHVARWVIAILGALVPSAPTYDTAPHDPADDGGTVPPDPAGPAQSTGKVTHVDQVQPLVHLLHALFGTSK